MKTIGIDQIIENVIEKLGNPEKVYLGGDFAKGINGDIIDLIIVGDINQAYLIRLIEKVEKQINKRVRYLVYPNGEHEKTLENGEWMLLWKTG
jgi:hypothetical protein